MKINKILTLVALLFFTVINLQAQDEKLLHIGGHIHLKNSFLNYENPDIVEGGNTFNYSVGFDMYYIASSRVELRFGVNYSAMKINQVDYTPSFGCDADGQGGFDLYNSYIEDKYQIQYIGIPINSKVKLFGNENHVYIMIGGEALFEIVANRKRILYECGNASIVTIETIGGRNVNNTVFKLMGGIGGEMLVTEKVKIFFEPRLDYSLNYLLKANDFGSEPTNDVKALELGMMIGLKF